MSTMRIVIVGAGLGGLRTAEALRAEGFDGELVLIGDEPAPPYSRPPLSKDFLAGRHQEADIALKATRELGACEWKLGLAVVRARLAEREVVLEDGTRLGYDGLVVASGVRSRRLDLPGPVHGRYALRSMADSKTLQGRLVAGTRVVVIGAGFIGCEVAATATTAGCEVTVVAPEAVPMERPLGAELGAALQRRHEAKGVRFRLSCGVGSLRGDDVVTGVELSTGEVLACDVLLEAVGSIPNTEWLAHNGLDLADGVLCDEHLRVESMVDVVAVGDVARFPHLQFGGTAARVEHWNIPGETARRAASTLARGLAGLEPVTEPFTPMPAFWTHQFDVRLQSFGLPGLGMADIRVLTGDVDEGVVMGYFRDGRLVGVVGTTGPKELLPYRAQLVSAP